MKYITQRLDTTADFIEIVTFCDLHIGEHNCDLKLLQKYIDYVKNNDNVYCMGIGDYTNNAIKSSKSFTHGAESPQKEFQQAYDMLGEIPTSRWLCFSSGNHGARSIREAGIDIDYLLAEKLGIGDIYSPLMTVVKVVLPKQTYWIASHHGAGGGGTKGGQANKLVNFSSIVRNADCVVLGHFHQQMSFVETHYEIDKKHDRVRKHDTMCIHGGSVLGYNDGYAEAMLLKPVAKGLAILKLHNIPNIVNGNTTKKRHIEVKWQL